jgi:acyl-homoserine-lactone acylase
MRNNTIINISTTVLSIVLITTSFLAKAQLNANVSIVRDTFGVPHIFGKTDADVVYGLAYAHCEDDFTNIQKALAMARHKLGLIKGKKGAGVDYYNQFIRAEQTVNEEYDKQLSPKFRLLLDNYAAGMNTYANSHPNEIILKGIFPVTGKDMIKGYYTIITGMVDGSDMLQACMKNEADNYIHNAGRGSNSFAMAASRSTDGSTMLAINPHVHLESMISWWEAHVCSEEGWNFHGSFFPMMIGPAMGASDKLAWGVTFNWPDYTDAYRMELNPKNPNEYMFDGKYIPFERSKATMNVKLKGVKIKVKKELLWCKYGPAIRTKHGVFGIRYNVMGNIRAAEQWFNMSHAKNLDEFKTAMKIRGIPLFNIVYADADNNIAHFFSGLVPVRDTAYNWQKVVPGNTSKTLWNTFIPFEDMPTTTNPSCGFVYNTNNTPWRNTCDAENIDSTKFPTNAAWHWNRPNGRDHRLRELIDAKDKHSFEEFKAIKFDNTYPQWENGIKKSLSAVKQLDITKYPDIKDAIEVINNWDFVSNVENRNMAMVLHTLARIGDLTHGFYNEMETGFIFTEAQLVQCIRESKKDLLKNFNTITPTLGQVQVVKRTNSDYELPMPGAPDQISPSYCKKIENGKYQVDKGDTFTMLVKYNKKTGNVFETQMPFGASNNSNSKHYNDQMKMYSTHKTKKVSLNKLDIIPVAEQIYSPK